VKYTLAEVEVGSYKFAEMLVGAPGAVAITTERAEELAEMLPAESVAIAVIDFVPTASDAVVQE
jgi:hypothetical protein